jgi:hypothetical protein
LPSTRAIENLTLKFWARANEETDYMRRLLLIAAAASIALVGLSANQCGGGSEEKAEPAKPAEEMPAKPDDSMSESAPGDSMSGDTGDSMESTPPAEDSMESTPPAEDSMSEEPMPEEEPAQ